jgi:hypothetical protein
MFAVVALIGTDVYFFGKIIRINVIVNSLGKYNLDIEGKFNLTRL